LIREIRVELAVHGDLAPNGIIDAAYFDPDTRVQVLHGCSPDQRVWFETEVLTHPLDYNFNSR
jgi:hypothetical protein